MTSQTFCCYSVEHIKLDTCAKLCDHQSNNNKVMMGGPHDHFITDGSKKVYVREVLFFILRGAPGNWGNQVLFLRSKGGSKDFFKLKWGDRLYSLKETKYFVKHFRFQRKGLSDTAQGRKLQWHLLSQCENVQLLSRFDVDFS